MTDHSASLRFSPCLHRRVVTVTTGTRRLSQGEVEDNIKVLLLCLDCLEYISEAEVRAARTGISLEILLGVGGDEDVNF